MGDVFPSLATPIDVRQVIGEAVEADRRPSPLTSEGAAAAGEYAPLNCEFRPPILHKLVGALVTGA